MKETAIVHAHNASHVFRLWQYFRIGWITYFGFLFAATNTIVVTYYLAIDNMPFLQGIFPTFAHYVITIILIGVPALIGSGYIHFQRTPAFKEESKIRVEGNRHDRRGILNGEVILLIVFRLNNLLVKKFNNKKLTEKELNEIYTLERKIQNYKNFRTLSEPVLSDIDKITNK